VDGRVEGVRSKEMLDWLFGKGDEAMCSIDDDGPDESRRHEDLLPAWLRPSGTRRDWDVLGECQRDANADGEPTELPAWRQSEAQLDELLSKSFWELERDAQQDSDRDGRSDADASEGQSQRTMSKSQRGRS